MKRKIVYVFVVLFSISSLLKAQTPLKADAGKDTVYCFNSEKSGNVVLGANPTASGGVSPYTYSWIIYSQRTGNILSFLSDNNMNHDSNPSFSYHSSDVYVCKVIVSDVNNTVAVDSSIIGISYLDRLLCCGIIDGTSGDSILLNSQIEGGVKPIEYKWSPIIGLSNPYIKSPKAKAFYPNITYYEEVIDSLGCKLKDEWGVTITDIKNGDLKTGYVSYKNPVSSSGTMNFTSELIGSNIRISSVTGTVLYQTKIEEPSIPLGSIIKTPGIYYYTVATTQGKVISGSFIKE